mmetsp:Transcript_14242/g.24224  ORF Transcript_14242/g.24224 Transcript_14242/m.24224 type:complete len:105 (-) Transcript_14242:1858-2172(-)
MARVDEHQHIISGVGGSSIREDGSQGISNQNDFFYLGKRQAVEGPGVANKDSPQKGTTFSDRQDDGDEATDEIQEFDFDELQDEIAIMGNSTANLRLFNLMNEI